MPRVAPAKENIMNSTCSMQKKIESLSKKNEEAEISMFGNEKDPVK